MSIFPSKIYQLSVHLKDNQNGQIISGWSYWLYSRNKYSLTALHLFMILFGYMMHLTITLVLTNECSQWPKAALEF